MFEKEGPNDGLVSLQSAQWVRVRPRSHVYARDARPQALTSASVRQGTYLGTLEGVNHLDLVGWINTARYKWAEIMGREIKFKPATFYLGIADHLARVVEGQEPPAAAQSAETRPELTQASSGERRLRERGEMADSLQKGEAQVRSSSGTPAAPGEGNTAPEKGQLGGPSSGGGKTAS